MLKSHVIPPSPPAGREKRRNILKRIGTKIQIFDENDSEVATIVGYEIRENATYLIVDNGICETKINVERENKAFRYID